ncbi:MAG: lipopolysaccharide biosynthesis protein [Cyclobacteriaceae bacterium]|nr:lipopolysaccharide biosynthesis protein [Cyclobacteriaceae bacterium]
MRDFFKAFFSFGLATSIQKLLGFIILPIYTRYFTTTEYGIIDMVGTVLSIASIFGVLQLENSLQRYYYEYSKLRRKLLVSNIYMWIGGCSLAISLLLIIFSNAISLKLFESTEFSILFVIVAVQLPFNNISMLGLVLLRFEKENLKFLKVIIVNVAFTLIFVYIFVINYDLKLSGVFYAQLCAMLLSSILATYYIRKSFVFKWSKIISQKNLKYALPMFPARVGSIVLSQANRFFMLGFLGLGAIGIYSVSMKLASSIQMVNTAFILAWAPFMHSQFKKKNNKVVFAKVFPLVVGGTFLCVCIITLFSQEMVKILASEEFYSSYKYVGGLSLFFSLYIIKEVVDIGPKINEKTKYLTYTFFCSVIINIVSLYILVQILNIEGVVIAMITTNLFLVGMSWFVSNRLYYIQFSITKFTLLIIPALSLSMLVMFYDLSITVRISIALLCITTYGLFLLTAFKALQKI